MASVKVLKETPTERTPGQWQLCFQWCQYRYDDYSTQQGYRFIWRRPDGKLQAARGQARIPSIKEMESLSAAAKAAGWGDNQGETASIE